MSLEPRLGSAVTCSGSSVTFPASVDALSIGRLATTVTSDETTGIPFASYVTVSVPVLSLNESGAAPEVAWRLSSAWHLWRRRRIRRGTGQLHVDVLDREGDQRIRPAEESLVEEGINGDANARPNIVERESTTRIGRRFELQFGNRDDDCGSGRAVCPQHGAFDATLRRGVRGNQQQRCAPKRGPTRSESTGFKS